MRDQLGRKTCTLPHRLRSPVCRGPSRTFRREKTASLIPLLQHEPGAAIPLNRGPRRAVLVCRGERMAAHSESNHITVIVKLRVPDFSPGTVGTQSLTAELRKLC